MKLFSEHADKISLERMSANDAAEIADFLNAIWPALYGTTGCIVFSDEYLRWLYGGPDGDRHLIRGLRIDGKLVAVEAALFRRLSDGKKNWRAYIATHLAIRPDLDFLTRALLAAKISETLTSGLGKNEMFLAFFEKAKGLAKSTNKIARNKSVQQVAEVPFRQAIVNTRKVLSVPKTITGLRTRDAAKSDMAAVQTLLRKTKSSLFLNSSRDSLWHHFSKAPDAFCLIAERDAETVGFIATYLLNWTKDGHVTRNVIAEVLLGDHSEYLAALLQEAATRAKALGARGVVLDNASYIDDGLAHDAGIMSIPKEMVMTMRSAQRQPPVDHGFLIDVK